MTHAPLAVGSWGGGTLIPGFDSAYSIATAWEMAAEGTPRSVPSARNRRLL